MLDVDPIVGSRDTFVGRLLRDVELRLLVVRKVLYSLLFSQICS